MRSVVACVLVMGATAAPAADIAGHYYLHHFREVGSELLLKPDGAFEFMLTYGAADYWAKGTWRVEDGSVILNSAAGGDAPPFRLVRSSAARTAGIRVHVVGANGRGAANIDVSILTDKGKLDARTDSDGIAVFPKKDAARSAVFGVRVYHLETEPIALNPEHNDFTFEINGHAITELRFDEERFRVDGKTLTTYYWGPDQAMHFAKEK